MTKQHSSDEPNAEQPNARLSYEVTREDLPLHCPMPGASLWNSHPRVFIPIEETGEAHCAYCSALFRLVDAGTAAPSGA